MRRLFLYAGLALAVFSCTYGGNDNNNNADSTDAKITTNSTIPMDSTGAYGNGTGSSIDTVLGTGSGLDSSRTRIRADSSTDGTDSGTVPGGGNNHPSTSGGGQ